MFFVSVRGLLRRPDVWPQIGWRPSKGGQRQGRLQELSAALRYSALASGSGKMSWTWLNYIKTVSADVVVCNNRSFQNLGSSWFADFSSQLKVFRATGFLEQVKQLKRSY